MSVHIIQVQIGIIFGRTLVSLSHNKFYTKLIPQAFNQQYLN